MKLSRTLVVGKEVLAALKAPAFNELAFIMLIDLPDESMFKRFKPLEFWNW